MVGRSAYHHGNLRAALLDAADEVLQVEGFQGFTMRACARSAGVSHAAPKHHFGDVRGLLTAVAERGFERLVAGLKRQLAQVQGNLDDEMFATARAYVDFAEAYPEHFRIMFRADVVNYDPEAPPASVTATFTELTNVILRQRGEPELTAEQTVQPKSPALINDILIGWSHVHGYAHLRLEGQLMMVPEESHLEHLRESSRRLARLIQATGSGFEAD